MNIRSQKMCFNYLDSLSKAQLPQAVAGLQETFGISREAALKILTDWMRKP